MKIYLGRIIKKWAMLKLRQQFFKIEKTGSLLMWSWEQLKGNTAFCTNDPFLILMKMIPSCPLPVFKIQVWVRWCKRKKSCKGEANYLAFMWIQISGACKIFFFPEGSSQESQNSLKYIPSYCFKDRKKCQLSVIGV